MKKLSSPLAKAVISLVNKRVKDSKSALPCVVTKLNSDSTVNLEVLTKSLDEITGEYILVELYDVDVDFPASYEDAYIRFPVKKGTTGSITIYDNDISALMDGGNETPVDVESPRSHNIDDCKFKPDFQTDQKKITIDANAEFRNKDMSIILYPDGKIEIKGASGKEMVAILYSFMTNVNSLSTNLKLLATNLMAATTVTALGASPFTPPTIALLTTDLGNITTDDANILTDKTDLFNLKKV